MLTKQVLLVTCNNFQVACRIEFISYFVPESIVGFLPLCNYVVNKLHIAPAAGLAAMIAGESWIVANWRCAVKLAIPFRQRSSTQRQNAPPRSARTVAIELFAAEQC